MVETRMEDESDSKDMQMQIRLKSILYLLSNEQLKMYLSNQNMRHNMKPVGFKFG